MQNTDVSPLLEQVCQILGADAMMYQTVDDLVAVGRGLNSAIETFDASCFDGVYCTGESLYCNTAHKA